jgi:DNA-binding beta-propeller fold protein YncE
MSSISRRRHPSRSQRWSSASSPRAGDQQGRHHGAGRQPRRRHGERAVDQRQGSQAGRHGVGECGAAKEQVSSVAITPDGKRALVAKFAANKLALLNIDGTKATYSKYDMPTGLWRYNVAITPDGKLAIAGNNGGAGSADGQIDTAAIIDMTADPPRVIDQVVVGDGPEGLAISPTGAYAVEVILNGANAPRDKFFYHPRSYVSLLKIDGKKVRKVSQTDVGARAEGVVWSPDGKYLYAGNFMDSDVTILRLDGDRLVNAGTLKLPGHPAPMRGSTP